MATTFDPVGPGGSSAREAGTSSIPTGEKHQRPAPFRRKISRERGRGAGGGASGGPYAAGATQGEKAATPHPLALPAWTTMTYGRPLVRPVTVAPVQVAEQVAYLPA